jgi:murein L,D-transpeptidase YafK
MHLHGNFYGDQRSFQIQAYPFRMTPMNLVKHLGNPNMTFWRMLKDGNDHFEVTNLEPKVDVCEKRYVFDAEPVAGVANYPSRNESASWQSNAVAAATSAVTVPFNPIGWCPAYEIPREIAVAVAEKNRRDESQMVEFVSRGSSTEPLQTRRDGAMHPLFPTGPLASGGS